MFFNACAAPPIPDDRLRVGAAVAEGLMVIAGVPRVNCAEVVGRLEVAFDRAERRPDEGVED